MAGADRLDEINLADIGDQLTNGDHVVAEHGGNHNGGGMGVWTACWGDKELILLVVLLGLFQITVKLPHDPYNIQVMVSFLGSVCLKEFC